ASLPSFHLPCRRSRSTVRRGEPGRIGADRIAGLWPPRSSFRRNDARIDLMDWVHTRLAAAVRLLIGLLGLGAAAGALAIAARPGQFVTYAGSSGGAALTLFAGLGLIAAGLVMSLGRSPGRTADLGLLAGLVWFAPVWVGWQEGPPLVRSGAMVLAGFTFPLVFHLVLAYPSGRMGSVSGRALVGIVYLETLLAAFFLPL